MAFVIKAGLMIIGLWLIIFIVTSWVNLLDGIEAEYEYCYNCKQGACFESPKTKYCEKWREEHENKGDESADNF